jgi:cytoskeletal protein RodZ
VSDKLLPQPYDNITLEEIGNLLREAREKAGLTKTDVSSRTKITLEQINNLENGHPPKIASVYARGFLRTYSELVELEGSEPIYAAYKRLTAHNDDDLDKPLTSKYMDNDFLAEPHSNVWTIVIVVLAVLVLSLGALYVSPSLRETVYGLLPESTRSRLPALQNAGQPPADTAEAPPAGPPAAEPRPAPAPETFQGRLTLRAEKTTWAQVVVDGEPLVHVLGEPGQSQSFEGLTSVNVIAGDGRALRMEWNGQDRGYLGHEGPVEVFFTLTPPES